MVVSNTRQPLLKVVIRIDKEIKNGKVQEKPVIGYLIPDKKS